VIQLYKIFTFCTSAAHHHLLSDGIDDGLVINSFKEFLPFKGIYLIVYFSCALSEEKSFGMIYDDLYRFVQIWIHICSLFYACLLICSFSDDFPPFFTHSLPVQE
jgi:hypothetical protein